MMHTIGHRSGGFIHCTYPPMAPRAQFRAQHSFQTIGTFNTLAAARRALTIWHRQRITQRTAEHFNYLQERTA